MTKVNLWIGILVFLSLTTIQGCATIGTLTEPETKNKIFSGTIRHVDLQCAHAVCLDAPFSLIADTLVLPVTIPWSVYNFLKSDEEQKPALQGNIEK
jgi:uncharacterized protein YceK